MHSKLLLVSSTDAVVLVWCAVTVLIHSLSDSCLSLSMVTMTYDKFNIYSIECKAWALLPESCCDFGCLLLSSFTTEMKLQRYSFIPRALRFVIRVWLSALGSTVHCFLFHTPAPRQRKSTSKGKKIKKAKREVKPRPLNGYMMFIREARAKVLKADAGRWRPTREIAFPCVVRKTEDPFCSEDCLSW